MVLVTTVQPRMPEPGPEGRAGLRSLEECSLVDRLSVGGSLDERRLPGWAVSVLEFPGRQIEARGVFVEGSLPVRRVSPRVVLSPDEIAARELRALRWDEGRALRNVRRSRRQIRHRCLALQADRLITLTKRGKFLSLDDAWCAWLRFSRLCKRFWPTRWAYVCVPERHADGTWHVHVAVSGFYWVGLLRRCWYKALGGRGDESGESTPGNVDVSEPRRSGRGASRRVAGYLAKYIGKDLRECVRGRRAFASSAGLVPVRVARWREPVHLGRKAVAVVVSRLARAYPGLTFCSREWSEAGVQGFSIWADYG